MSLEFEKHVECIYYIHGMLVCMQTAEVWVGMMEAKVLCVCVYSMYITALAMTLLT